MGQEDNPDYPVDRLVFSLIGDENATDSAKIAAGLIVAVSLAKRSDPDSPITAELLKAGIDKLWPAENPQQRWENSILHGSKDGVGLIRDERLRQPTLGWTKEHDQEHATGELVLAALCYQAVPGLKVALQSTSATLSSLWPWDPQKDPQLPAIGNDTPQARIDSLKKAGALIAAEIDRLLPLVKPITAADIREAVKHLEKENTLGGTRKRWYHTEPAIDADLRIHRYAPSSDGNDRPVMASPQNTTLCGKLLAGMEDYHGWVFGNAGAEMGDRRQRIAMTGNIADHACPFCHRVEQEEGVPELYTVPKREQS